MNVTHHQHDDFQALNDEVVLDESSLSLEMDDEACRNVADFFSILNDWQLNNNSKEVGYHEK